MAVNTYSVSSDGNDRLSANFTVREFASRDGADTVLIDEELVDVLQQKGYKVARRTVAKYREQLGIPIARLRKQL